MSRAAPRGRTLAAAGVAALLHAGFVAWLLASATRLWRPGERPAVELALSAPAHPPASTAATAPKP